MVYVCPACAENLAMLVHLPTVVPSRQLREATTLELTVTVRLKHHSGTGPPARYVTHAPCGLFHDAVAPKHIQQVSLCDGTLLVVLEYRSIHLTHVRITRERWTGQ